MSGLTADATYGVIPGGNQPTATPLPLHAGSPEPSMATHPAGSRASSPIMAVIVLLALAVLLTQVSFRGEVAVKA